MENEVSGADDVEDEKELSLKLPLSIPVPVNGRRHHSYLNESSLDFSSVEGAEKECPAFHRFAKYPTDVDGA